MISIYSPEVPLDVTELLPVNGRFDNTEHAQQVGQIVLDRLYEGLGDWTEVPVGHEMSADSIAAISHDLVVLPSGLNTFRSRIGGGSFLYSLPLDGEEDYRTGEIKLFEWDADFNTLIMTQRGRFNRERDFATAVATALPLEDLLDKQQKVQFAGF